jgi:uncharacterized protein (TIGR03083 family)
MASDDNPPVAIAPEDFVAHLQGAAARFAAVLADADLRTPVPACPGWDLRALAGHLGGIHRWARRTIVEGRPTDEGGEGPADPGELRAWFETGARELAATLRSTDPATPCWTFGPSPRTAAFWARRQAHETTVHAWDAEQAVSWQPSWPDHELVLDGIDEVVSMFVPRQIRLRRLAPIPHVVELRVSEDPARWRLPTLMDDGGGTARPAAVVRAPPRTMLLLLWRRVGVDHPEVRIEGDVEAARAVLASPLTP